MPTRSRAVAPWYLSTGNHGNRRPDRNHGGFDGCPAAGWRAGIPDPACAAPRTLVVRRHQLTAMCIQDATCLDSVSTALLHRIRAHPGLAEPELEHSNRKRQDRLTIQAGVARPSCCDACPRVASWWPACISSNCQNWVVSKAKWQLLRSVGAPEPGQQSATVCGGRAAARTILYMAAMPAAAEV